VTSELQCYRLKLSHVLCLIPNIGDLSVSTPGETTNTQTISDFCPRVVKNVVGYCSLSVPYVGFKVLKIVVVDLVDEVSLNPGGGGGNYFC
jgi:hypothetical protein